MEAGLELSLPYDPAADLQQLLLDNHSLRGQLELHKQRTGELECQVDEMTTLLEELNSEKTRVEKELAEKGSRLRQVELELRTAISKVAELKGELRLKSGTAEMLQAQISGLKQELAREPLQARAGGDKLATLYQGAPGEVFSNVLEEVLGPVGRSLVEQIYQRYHVDIRSTHVEELALVAERLQSLALKLARSPEQAERIRLGLNRCRTFLEIPADAEPLRPAVPPRPVNRPRPELMPLTNADSELGRKLEAGMKLVTLERYEQALNVFRELAPLYPECVEVYSGLFYAYTGFGCWAQAYEMGRKIQPALSGEALLRFLKAYSRVVSELVDSCRDPRQAKRWLLELAELHATDPRRALGFLRRASRIPELIEEESRIDALLLELLPQVDQKSAVQAIARSGAA
ncbi:MAG: hypothetical protein AB1758_00600 [Candidatus Eremiobacterota bacterium]